MILSTNVDSIEFCFCSLYSGVYRKLRAILNNGYSCYVGCVVNGADEPAHTPAEFN